MALHRTYEIRWKNFKGFKDTGWVKIKPITILLGPNNTGKTSFISPLLLMSQTISSRDSYTPIVTRGRLLDSGVYKDIVNKYNTSIPLFFGFRYHVHEQKGRLKKIGTYPPGVLEITYGYDKKSGKPVLRSQEIFDMFNRPFLKLSRSIAGINKLSGLDINKMSKIEQKAIQKSRPRNFLFSPTPVLYNLESKGTDSIYSTKKFTTEFQSFIQAIGYNYSEIRDIFNNLTYIGPLREKPHRYYEIAGETLKTVGPRGENMPNLLKRNYEKFKSDLNKWIKEFEFGDNLQISNVSDELFSISFEDIKSKTSTNIANAGFGASQILPLIVQTLASPDDSLTIAEQPEIHLNPKLQCVLADLFVHMANNDQRIIVETHSEHLLLRLRRLIAEKKIDHNNVAIYFVEKIKGESKIREIEMKPNGHIPEINWPKGFFGESLKEAMALAIGQSKNKPVRRTKPPLNKK